MDYGLIGRTSATHGLEGRLTITHTLTYAAFRKLQHVFIEVRPQSYIPYFIEQQKKVDDQTVLVYLDEVNSLEEAKKVSGKNIYIEQEILQNISPKSLPGNLEGFTVQDKNLGVLGTIENLFETPGQVLATLSYQQKEIIIPLIDSTIESIDGARRTILVSLPEGLLDVYL